MLDIHRPEASRDTKIYFTHSLLPSYIDPINLPTRKQPFHTFNKHAFNYALDLVLPEGLWECVRLALEKDIMFHNPQYARAHLSLSEILEEEFLNSYINQGNITMLSEGRQFIDDCFELHRGTLIMELSKQTYERCGLPGIVIEDGGKKHQKQRFMVTHDLRSMKSGGKSFARLRWACANVLNQSLIWLFYNANPSSAEALEDGKEILCKHAPRIVNFSPTILHHRDVTGPIVSTESPDGQPIDNNSAIDLLEWLHLLHIASPRIKLHDHVDPYLSRYEVPDLNLGTKTRSFVHVSWRGFMPSTFASDLFLLVRSAGFKAQRPKDGEKSLLHAGEQNEGIIAAPKEWFALSAQAVRGANGWTVMQFVDKETLTWAVER